LKSKDDLHSNARKKLELYYYMRLNRDLEEQMVRLFRQNKIVGGLYSSFGQEAISVALPRAGPGDWIAPMIRNIGALLVRGFKPREYSDAAHGSLHFADAWQGWHQPFRRTEIAARRLAVSMLGDLIPVMTASHGGTLPRSEDCDNDMDRRRRDLHRRVPRRIESGGGAEGPSRTDRGK